MAWREPMVEALTQRLDRLEGENRRWKRAAAALAVGIAAVVLMGQVHPAGKVVEAEQFVLRDPAGRFRGTLGVGADGTLALTLADKDGKARAELAVRAGGAPALALADKDGKPRAGLAVLPDGKAALTLADKDGKGRALLGVGADGTPVLAILDRDGKVIWRAPQRGEED